MQPLNFSCTFYSNTYNSGLSNLKQKAHTKKQANKLHSLHEQRNGGLGNIKNFGNITSILIGAKLMPESSL